MGRGPNPFRQHEQSDVTAIIAYCYYDRLDKKNRMITRFYLLARYSLLTSIIQEEQSQFGDMFQFERFGPQQYGVV